MFVKGMGLQSTPIRFEIGCPERLKRFRQRKTDERKADSVSHNRIRSGQPRWALGGLYCTRRPLVETNETFSDKDRLLRLRSVLAMIPVSKSARYGGVACGH